MSSFIISAFSDEIDTNLDVQMKVLTEHDIKHIEMRGVDGKNVSELSVDEAKVIKKRLDDKGFAISALGSPVGKIGINDNFEEHLEMFDNLLEVASIFQTKYIRIFSFFIPKGEDASSYRQEVMSRLKTLTERAEKTGVILLHENEKEIYGDTAERCLDILQTINSPYLRATFDPANFIQCKVVPYPDAFTLLRDYIEYVHIKDAFLETGNVVPAGHGDGRIEQMIVELKEMDYNGFLSLEPHLGAFHGLDKLENILDVSKIKKGGKESFEVAVEALYKILSSVK